jgi:DNA-binding PadR family transcriptional regulator
MNDKLTLPLVALYYRKSMTKSSPRQHSARSDDRQDLYSGLIRIHILFHACEGPIFGLGMIEELAHHGYRVSPGTLYPVLHGLEKRGLLRSRQVRVGAGNWLRREYQATPAGHQALRVAKRRVRELFGEIFDMK